MAKTRLRIKLRHFKLNKQKLDDDLDRYYNELMRDAANAFLTETSDRVPVWTGMAKATLLGLANYLHTYLEIHPKATTDVINKMASEHHSIQDGRRLSGGGGYGHNEYIRRVGNVYTFSWRSSVEHYNYNDVNDASLDGYKLRNPTPWWSVRAGDAAFRQTLMDALYNSKVSIKKYLEIEDGYDLEQDEF